MQCVVLLAGVLAVNTTGLVPTSDPEALSVDEGRGLAYVADRAGLDVVRIDGTPRVVAEVALPSSVGVGHGMLGDGYVVCVCSSYGLAIINVTTPEAPALLGTMKLYGALHVTVKNSIAYVSARSGGLLLISIATPSAPVILSTLKVPDAYDTYITGSTAYIANYRLGLIIADVSDPRSPLKTFEFDSPKFSYVHEVRPVPGSDVLVYVCDEDNGFFVLDVAQNKVVAEYEKPVDTVRMAVKEDVVYLASFSMGLLQVDTTYVLSPKITDTLSGATIGVGLAGDAFLSLEPGVGLRVFTLAADPTDSPFPPTRTMPIPSIPDTPNPVTPPTYETPEDSPAKHSSSGGRTAVYAAVGGSMVLLLLVVIGALVALHWKNRRMVRAVGEENLDQPLEGVAFNPELNMGVLEETEVVELAE